jgi:hypothetical protein
MGLVLFCFGEGALLEKLYLFHPREHSRDHGLYRGPVDRLALTPRFIERYSGNRL